MAKRMTKEEEAQEIQRAKWREIGARYRANKKAKAAAADPTGAPDETPSAKRSRVRREQRAAKEAS